MIGGPQRPAGRRWRALALGLGVVASAAAPAAPAPERGACSSPVAFARSVFERHRDFYWDDAHHDPNLLTPRFVAALRREWAVAQGEVGALDVDPWLGAQDGDIGAPVTFRLLSAKGGTSTVVMDYPFLPAPGARPQVRRVRLLLRRAAGACWQLDDLVTPAGQSLRKLFAPAQPAGRP